MTEKRRNFKIVIEDATLTQNVFLLNAPNKNAAITQLSWLFNRMGVTVVGDLTRRIRRFSILKGKLRGSKVTAPARSRKSSKGSPRCTIYSLVPDNISTWETPRSYRAKRAIRMRVVDLYYKKKLDTKAKGN